jgi:stage II sporulation protein D
MTGPCALAILGLSVFLAPGARPVPTLRVRILERAAPLRVVLESRTGVLSCDGRSLRTARETLEVDGGQILLSSGLRCRGVFAPGEDVRLETEGEQTDYRGAVRATIVAGRLSLVNEVVLETYLSSVVGSELPPGRPEALKAQAVASRTFALASLSRHRSSGYDLCDRTHCQLYRGRGAEHPEAARAVTETEDEILRHRGALRPAYFHAACGGRTSTPAEVFGDPEGGAAVSDEAEASGSLCQGAEGFAWSWAIGREPLAKALAAPPAGRAFEVLKRDRGGRVLSLLAFGRPFTGQGFFSRVGKAFGYQKLRSLSVRAREVDGTVRFEGTGLGHGVGMCQSGALELDRRGRDYRAILRHYFPAATLERR